MFTQKTVVVTSKMSGKLSKSVGKIMDKGMDLLDAGMDLLDEAIKGSPDPDTVSTTIRVRLTTQQLCEVAGGVPLIFKAAGQTIILEHKP